MDGLAGGKRMSWRTGTLRGCIGARWDAAGQPGWDVERLVQVARECDIELEACGQEPCSYIPPQPQERKPRVRGGLGPLPPGTMVLTQ